MFVHKTVPHPQWAWRSGQVFLTGDTNMSVTHLACLFKLFWYPALIPALGRSHIWRGWGGIYLRGVLQKTTHLPAAGIKKMRATAPYCCTCAITGRAVCDLFNMDGPSWHKLGKVWKFVHTKHKFPNFLSRSLLSYWFMRLLLMICLDKITHHCGAEQFYRDELVQSSFSHTELM